jgi:hypothetical protein
VKKIEPRISSKFLSSRVAALLIPFTKGRMTGKEERLRGMGWE